MLRLVTLSGDDRAGREAHMFKEQLAKIAKHLEGVQACVLLDADAIPIEELYLDAADKDVIGALAVELANLISSFRKRGVLEDVGAMHELTLSTERTTALARTIANEFLLLVALDPDSDPVRGRTMLRVVAPWIERNL